MDFPPSLEIRVPLHHATSSDLIAGRRERACLKTMNQERIFNPKIARVRWDHIYYTSKLDTYLNGRDVEVDRR
jgi:hypothetical protein